ncbi:MAG: hypothetical protein H6744_05895 [Deltaproteobacteria bacterium]|nr:hypothetical protein [Deltaproteobacteria bacterium]MCB9786211.1 hypothetical protein [Deltaproteobacteria bacterium]
MNPRIARGPKARILLHSLAALAASCLLAASAAGCAHSKAAEKSEPAEYTEHPVVHWKGFTYRAGQKVRLENRAGTFKPVDTGASEDVVAAPGQVGVILGGETRKATRYFTPKPDEPIQVIRVRWPMQDWQTVSGKTVRLGEFEATVHADYLRPVE